MNLLLIDTETTGLKPDEGAIPIEVGAVLFNVKKRAILQSVSFLLPTDKNAAEHINGISPDITTMDQPWRSGVAFFMEMVSVADFAVAHNSDFDQQWFGVGKLPALNLKWLDSMAFDWGQVPGRSLKDIALHHGVTVTPDHHRALPDVLLLAAVLTRRSDLERIVVDASKPRKLFKAVVTYAQRQLAKDAGFRWDGEKRSWVKKLSYDEITDYKFKVLPMPGV